MISVADALTHLFALTKQLPVENVPLAQANGRTLAEPVSANRDQPPFSASAMDGYAIVSNGAAPGKSYDVIGEAAAGHAFDGTVSAGQAVRIFTGARVPEGADRVVCLLYPSDAADERPSGALRGRRRPTKKTTAAT